MSSCRYCALFDNIWVGHFSCICLSPLTAVLEEGDDNSETEDEEGPDDLGISDSNAQFNYERAGTLVAEGKLPIKIEDYKDHILPGVEDELDRLLLELNIPYALTEFQRTGACVLASGNSLFLILPTGEGKLTVGLIAAHLLRRVRNQPNGVAIITQPLTRESFLAFNYCKMICSYWHCKEVLSKDMHTSISVAFISRIGVLARCKPIFRFDDGTTRHPLGQCCCAHNVWTSNCWRGG